MKILLIGNYEYNRQESMQRFAALLRKCLTEAGCDVRLIQPVPVMGRFKPGVNGVGKWLGYFDRFVLFRPQLRKMVQWADVVHICDQANAVYILLLKGKPNVVTCHDMLAIRGALGEFPQNSTRLSGRIFQRWILSGIRCAQRIVCVSEQTKIDLLRVANLSPKRVTVTPNSLNYPYRPMEIGESAKRLNDMGLTEDRPFLLHVGGNQWYKNREGVLRIFSYFSKLPGNELHLLVMAGAPWTRRMHNFVREMDLTGSVKELVEVPNEDLRALYSAAEALIFPSLQEGFGWPIIEAQACGCPVVTTNRAPMTDTGGTAAVYIDPKDEIAAANIIAECLKNRHAVREAGLLNVGRFSTRSMVGDYLNAYGTAIAEAAKTRVQGGAH